MQWLAEYLLQGQLLSAAGIVQHCYKLVGLAY
jgi:hypothetical protein